MTIFADLSAPVAVTYSLGTLFVVHNALQDEADEAASMLASLRAINPPVSQDIIEGAAATVARLMNDAEYTWAAIQLEKARQGRGIIRNSDDPLMVGETLIDEYGNEYYSAPVEPDVDFIYDEMKEEM